MAENQLELGFKVGLPDLIPLTAELSASYHRRWGERDEEFHRDLAEHGVGRQEITDLVDTDPKFADLYLDARVRATRVDSNFYSEALARLLVATLDVAQVDEAGYLLNQILRLEPFDLRCVFACVEFLKRDGMGAWISSEAACAVMFKRINGFANDIVKAEGVRLAAAETSLRAAAATNLIELVPAGDRWQLTNWGAQAIQMMFPTINEMHSQ